MFNVKLNVTVAIQGCPDNGLAAVDFRKEHGLKTEPTKFVNIVYEANDEAFCRHFPYLNKDADFLFESGFNRYGNLDLSFSNTTKAARIAEVSIPVSIAKLAEDVITSETAQQIMAAIVESDAALNRAAEEKLEAERRGKDAKIMAAIAELEAMDDATLLSNMSGLKSDGIRGMNLNHRHRDLLTVNGRDYRFPFGDETTLEPRAVNVAYRICRLLDAHNAGIVSEKDRWIEEHGSDRLKTLVAESIEHHAVYQDELREWVRSLLPAGWCLDCDFLSNAGDKPRNCSEEEIQLLRAAREFADDAKLEYYTVDRDDDEEDDEDEDSDGETPSKYVWTGCLPVSHRHGYKIVFGAPARFVTVD